MRPFPFRFSFGHLSESCFSPRQKKTVFRAEPRDDSNCLLFAPRRTRRTRPFFAWTRRRPVHALPTSARVPTTAREHDPQALRLSARGRAKIQAQKWCLYAREHVAQRPRRRRSTSSQRSMSRGSIFGSPHRNDHEPALCAHPRVPPVRRASLGTHDRDESEGARDTATLAALIHPTLGVEQSALVAYCADIRRLLAR